LTGDEPEGGKGPGPADPGIVKVFAGGAPAWEAVRLQGGRGTVGRSRSCALSLDDARVSREHAEITFADERWAVRDLGSHNGTVLDGDAVRGRAVESARGVLRVGETILLLRRNIGAFLGEGASVSGGVVMGPQLRAAWQEIESAAAGSEVLHIAGETGTGKELAARHFHEAGPHPPASGPFVAVNCAAIPPPLAERLLFGALRGAYSGADTSTEGYLKSADGGTLFLDEVAELAPEVQSKLLRALESREVMPLGAARAQKIRVRFCSASNAGLRAAVAAGAFREDLYHRIGRPSVRLAPLRERPEEIPALVHSVIRARDPKLEASASLIEAALLRHWPGNVRELIKEMGAAATSAARQGSRLTPRCLSETAGVAIAPAARPSVATLPPVAASLERDAVLQALERERGSVARSARALGVSRTTFRRWLEKNGVDPKQFAGS
jgi:transcriptional regulator with PAS, ATPase and Fis domain